MTLGYAILVHRDDGYTRLVRSMRHARRLRGRALRRGRTVTTACVCICGEPVMSPDGTTATLQLRATVDGVPPPPLEVYLRDAA